MTSNVVSITERDVTPEEAADLMSRNDHNRGLRKAVVARYADDMRSGNWRLTGAAIVMARDGTLLDGQHRLAACIKAGVPFRTIVLEGADPDVQVAMDTGLKRQLHDVLKLRGEADSVNLAAAVKTGWQWITLPSPNAGTNPTVAQALEWLERNPSIRDSLHIARSLSRALSVPKGVSAAVHHQVAMIDAAEGDAFFHDIMTGENLAAGSPTLTLRNWLINQKAMPGGRGRYPVIYHALMVKAWNAWITGQPIMNLRWRRGGHAPEQFPELLDVDGLAVEVHHEKAS